MHLWVYISGWTTECLDYVLTIQPVFIYLLKVIAEEFALVTWVGMKVKAKDSFSAASITWLDSHVIQPRVKTQLLSMHDPMCSASWGKLG